MLLIFLRDALEAVQGEFLKANGTFETQPLQSHRKNKRERGHSLRSLYENLYEKYKNERCKSNIAYSSSLAL
jgi:hypothetical protein